MIVPQYIHGFACRYLLSLDVLYPLRFSGCGFGFCCGFLEWTHEWGCANLSPLTRRTDGSVCLLRQRALTAYPAEGVSVSAPPCPLRHRGLYVIFDGKRLPPFGRRVLTAYPAGVSRIVTPPLPPSSTRSKLAEFPVSIFACLFLRGFAMPVLIVFSVWWMGRHICDRRWSYGQKCP